MENKEKYLQRIKKLLAMARNNSSAEEAALAMSRAQKLMSEHKLNEHDIDVMNINEAATQKAPSHAEKMPEYMAFLAEMVARVFGVKFYTSHGSDHWNKPAKRTIHYYGPDERPQIAAYSFEVLGKQLAKARREYIATMRKNIKPATKIARADTFCSAWVNGAYAVVSDFVVTEAETTLIEAYRERKLSKGMKTLEPRKPGKARGTDDAEIQGYSHGRNAQLHHAVSGSSTQTTLIGASK
ncbi:DUF2786 domain-containing protein [Phytobacter diazotrophicus]|uniref:DUF2786 domain-containing protein n=1 Tax=Phytobacter diazotrophicus TaxID=395631 RepID=UPI001451D274|nr:DUF2786 domain-containing protein [Phytobacter diazotrophicus]QJF16639.1 DUF2786 domain-containing protein [Phytobacter diazotrophicus]